MIISRIVLSSTGRTQVVNVNPKMSCHWGTRSKWVAQIYISLFYKHRIGSHFDDLVYSSLACKEDGGG